MCGRGGRTTFLTDLLSTREPFFSTGFERNCMTAGVGATDGARTAAREAMADGFTKPWHLWPRRGACGAACARPLQGLCVCCGCKGRAHEARSARKRKLRIVVLGEMSKMGWVSLTPKSIMAPHFAEFFGGGKAEL